MTASLYRPTDKQVAAGLSADEMRKAIDSGTGLLWVDVDDSDPTSMHVLQEVFRFHPLAIEDCFNDRVDTAKIDDYGSYLFIVSQGVTYAARSAQLVLTELNLFLGSNYLVSVHQAPLLSLNELFERCQKDDHLLARGADFLTHTLLDGLVDELLPAVELMDEELNELQRRILERPQQPQLTGGPALQAKYTTAAALHHSPARHRQPALARGVSSPDPPGGGHLLSRHLRPRCASRADAGWLARLGRRRPHQLLVGGQ
jgi:Mg2+ and Co2+ transporter CorA